MSVFHHPTARGVNEVGKSAVTPPIPPEIKFQKGGCTIYRSGGSSRKLIPTRQDVSENSPVIIRNASSPGRNMLLEKGGLVYVKPIGIIGMEGYRYYISTDKTAKKDPTSFQQMNVASAKKGKKKR